MGEITSRKSLVSAVAGILQTCYGEEQPLINLTSQDVGFWLDPMVVGEDSRWPVDGDEVIKIEKPSSRESFQVMADFADSQSGDIADRLYRALDGRHPFARFKDVVCLMGISDKWYAYRDKRYEEMADRWLHLTGTDVKDGKIVTTCKPITWSREYEDAF